MIDALRRWAAPPSPEYIHPSLKRSVLVLTPAPLSTSPYLGPKRKRKAKVPKRHRKPLAPVPGN